MSEQRKAGFLYRVRAEKGWLLGGLASSVKDNFASLPKNPLNLEAETLYMPKYYRPNTKHQILAPNYSLTIITLNMHPADLHFQVVQQPLKGILS